MLKEKFELLLENYKNVRLFSEVIFEKAEDNEEETKRIAYQVIEDLNHTDEDTILENLQARKYGWNHDSLKKYQDIEYEQDCFIIQPFEIIEGIVDCKCGSKRVYSFSKQTRSGDESITTFNECLVCKSKWVYSG